MNEHNPTFKTQGLESAEFPPVNPTDNPTMGELISRRFSRRGFLKGSLATTAIAVTVSPIAMMTADKAQAAEGSAFSFEEVAAGVDADHHVAPGYNADVLIRWGDPVVPGAPEFDPENQTAEAQARQFGYNNDYVGYVPLDGSSEHGLLLVNHEYTNPHLMFPGLVTIEGGKPVQGPLSEEQVNIEIAAHGGSIIEIEKVDGKWRVVPDSSYNRRITGETEIMISGPVAGHERLQTGEDPTGTRVRGTFNNCAGGTTP